MQKRIYNEHHELLTALNQFSTIRYVAYRTAVKLKFLQSQTKLDCIRYIQIFRVIDDFGLRSTEKDLLLTMNEIGQLVHNIYFQAQKSQLVHLDYKFSSKIVLDLIKETYDKNGLKKGCTLLDLLVFFTILCGETTLGEKYRKLLQLIADHNSCIQRRSLALLLKSIASLPHLVNEAPGFGHWTVLAAVQQCFEQCTDSPRGVPEDMVFSWMVREPQSLVWWSTLYRINASSKVIHPVRCSVCNSQSIQGLRYQCLQCLSYNQCQQCFWLGLISKNHKVTHQMQEYCTRTTSKEATQALWKKMSNWLALKKNRSLPARYLPLERGNQFKSSEISLFNEPHGSNSNLVNESTVTYQIDKRPKEIDSVVGHLIEEKGKLESVVQQVDLANSLGPLVKEHCDQLELQLRRLRQLVSNKDLTRPIPQVQRVLTRLESTPLLPSQQRKNNLEQLNLSPIDEPGSIIQRSARVRQSLRTVKKAPVVTNGTLSYCTPRFQRKLVENYSFGNNNETDEGAPRFATNFSLHDLSRNLRQPSALNSLSQSSSSTVDSALNAELEEILAQLDQLFPSHPSNVISFGSGVRIDPSENGTVLKATNQIAGVLAEFVDGFNE